MEIKTHPSWQLFLEDILPHQWSKEQIIARAQACQIEMPVRACLDQVTPEIEMEYAARNSLYWLTLQQVTVALDNIKFLILKGPALAIRIFGNECYRQSADVDIWLSEMDLICADKMLRNLGYIPKKVVRRWATNQVLYIPNHPLLLPVELHWALTQPPLRPPCFEDAWNRRVTVYHDQIQFYTLDDTDTWMGLIFHAMQHVFALKPWMDLAAAASVLHIDEDRIHQFGLDYLHTCIKEVINGVEIKTYRSTKLRVHHRLGLKTPRIMRTLLRQIFMSQYVGTLIVGENSSCQSAFAAFSRMASMLFLDGFFYPLRSIVFYIPLGLDIIRNKIIPL